MPGLRTVGGAAFCLACLFGLAAMVLAGPAQAEEPSQPPSIGKPPSPPPSPPLAPAPAAERPATKSGLDNYLIPVPADLPQRQLAARKRLDVQRQAERQAAAQQAEEERARQAASPPRPSHETVVMPLGGFMYH